MTTAAAAAAAAATQVHLSKNAAGTYNFNPVSVNFLVELTKTIIALIVLLFVVRGAPSGAATALPLAAANQLALPCAAGTHMPACAAAAAAGPGRTPGLG